MVIAKNKNQERMLPYFDFLSPNVGHVSQRHNVGERLCVNQYDPVTHVQYYNNCIWGHKCKPDDEYFEGGGNTDFLGQVTFSSVQKKSTCTLTF